MFREIVKWILIIGFVSIAVYLSRVSYKSPIVSKIRTGQKIACVITGTHVEKKSLFFDGAMVSVYDSETKNIMFFPLHPGMFVLKENDRKRSLAYIVRKLYRKNKRDRIQMQKAFVGWLANETGIEFDFHVMIDPDRFQKIRTLVYEKDVNSIVPLYSECFPKARSDHASALEYAGFVWFLEYLKKGRMLFKVISLLNSIKSYISHVKMLDTIALLREYQYYKKNNVIFVMPQTNSDRTYDMGQIKSFLNSKFEEEPDFRIEVFNASGKTKAAFIMARFFRAHGIDVQLWDNYQRGNEEKTMVIDRTGNWKNAHKVAQLFDGDIIFSGKNLSRFVDVSVIIGKDMIPFIDKLARDAI